MLALLLVTGCCPNNKCTEQPTIKSALDVIHSRKSVRTYTDQPVTMEQIDTLLRAGMSAPSGMDRRPWEFIVVTDRDLMRQWADTLPYAAMLKQAQVAIVVCGRSDKDNGGSPYWYVDCSAVTENILLAAEAIGLGAVWTAAYPYEERMGVVYSAYNLPKDIVPLCIIPIGYPTGVEQPKIKYDSTRIHINKW